MDCQGDCHGAKKNQKEDQEDQAEVKELGRAPLAVLGFVFVFDLYWTSMKVANTPNVGLVIEI